MFWILLAVILAAGEVMTLGFFLAPFAAGALLGAAADLAGAGSVVAVLVFLISSGLFFGLLRPSRGATCARPRSCARARRRSSARPRR